MSETNAAEKLYSYIDRAEELGIPMTLQRDKLDGLVDPNTGKVFEGKEYALSMIAMDVMLALLNSAIDVIKEGYK